MSAALVTGLSNANASIANVSSGLSTANSNAVVLSSAVVSGLSSANASIANVSTGLSTANSNAVVLSSAVVSGLSNANASIANLSTGLSRANASIVAVSSGLNAEVLRATNAETSLSNGLAAEVSRKVMLSTNLASAIESIIITNASVGLLSSSLSLEIERAIFNEESLTSSISRINTSTAQLSSAISSAVSVNAAQSLSITGLSSGLSTTNSTAVVLSSSVSSLKTSLSIVQRQIVKTKVVPINQTTIQSNSGFLEPMYLATYPISSGNPVDGWWYSKSSGSGSISWKTSLSSPVYIGGNLAQISFTCYISSPPANIYDLPYLVLPNINNNLVLAFSAENLTNITAAGEYTFIANLNGNSPGVTYFGDKTIPLVFNPAYSLNPDGEVPTSFTYSEYNASSIQHFNIATDPSSNNINMIVENMQVEIINGGGPLLESGTYQFLFSSSAVNQKYLHNATNYLYSYFFQQSMLDVVAYNS